MEALNKKKKICLAGQKGHYMIFLTCLQLRIHYENFRSLKYIWWIIDDKDFYQCLYVSFKGQQMS